MKRQIFIAILLGFSISVFGQVNPQYRPQRSYYKRDGTYVKPHLKTTLNETNHDNYSTERNTNPHTGTAGSRAKDYSPQAKNYGQGKTIHTGSRGGQFYYNNKGNKVYVPKRRN